MIRLNKKDGQNEDDLLSPHGTTATLNRFELACEAGLVGIFEWCPMQNQVFVSQSLLNLLDLEGGLPADPADWLDFVGQQSCGEVLLEIERCLEVPCNKLTRWCREERSRVWVFRTKSGSERVFLCRWSVECDDNAAITAVFGALVDLTDSLRDINQDHFWLPPF